ncbi:MAG: acyl-CoA dehydrogenase family protein, partial [Myxococcales bacterium]|nr:acyl-CoA dehydrogenase family protein [Myxococcales bacterium]
MHFDFSEDQRLLQQAVADFLAGECAPDQVRARWDTETGRDPAFWKRLAEVGVPGLLVPEADGGLGLDETDLVLLLEETGRVALAEPVIPTTVGVGLLREIGGDPAATWLPRVAAGDAILAVGHEQSPFVSDAHVADLLLLPRDGALHAVARADARLEAQPANDGSQRLFRVAFD